MISGAQIRAARALLGWTSDDLAEKVGYSGVTIRSIETGKNKHPHNSTLEKIYSVLVDGGVEFTDNDGVKRRSQSLEVFVGQERFNLFMAYLLSDLKENGGEVVVSLNDERVFQKYIQNIEVFRREMMELDKAGRIKGRILAVEGNFIRTWGDLRRAPKANKNSTVSFYVFNDNFALVSFAEGKPYVELRKNSPFANDFRRLFNLMWESAEDP